MLGVGLAKTLATKAVALGAKKAIFAASKYAAKHGVRYAARHGTRWVYRNGYRWAKRKAYRWVRAKGTGQRRTRCPENDVRGLRSLESIRTSKGMDGEHVDVLLRPEKDDDGSRGKPPNGSRNKYADGFVLQPTADTEHMQTTICPTFTRNQLENRNSRKLVGAIDALIPSSTGP